MLLIQISKPSSTTPSARLQPISFFSTGSSGSYSIFFSSSENLGCSGMAKSLRSSTGRQRRLDSVEKQPGDDQPDPDDEAEQADEIDRGEPANAFLPKPPEIRNDADGEEGQDKEQEPENMRAGGDGLADRNVTGRVDTPNQQDNERQSVAEDEFGEALPDFDGAHLFAGPVFNFRAPDQGKDERPHADEHVDENHQRRRGHCHPAFLILHPACGQCPGANQRVR